MLAVLCIHFPTVTGKSSEADAAIEQGDCDVTFSSPESLAEQWVKSVDNVIVSLIVVGECHTVSVLESFSALDINI